MCRRECKAEASHSCHGSELDGPGRRHDLGHGRKIGLKNTDLEGLRTQHVPFLYNFSSAVVPRPLDWSDLIGISGYWTLPANSDKCAPVASIAANAYRYDPPQDIVDFIAKARADKKPLVYIGFGSITVPDPVAMTEAIVQAVHASGVRAILSKGWSARMSKVEDKTVIPKEEIYVVEVRVQCCV